MKCILVYFNNVLLYCKVTGEVHFFLAMALTPLKAELQKSLWQKQEVPKFTTSHLYTEGYKLLTFMDIASLRFVQQTWRKI